ncbi:interferon a3-like [Archocentrus centrarchus]|uniref:interferon a3-like n=1 Tax=Archocentrus centrarchus TaxID=63155 RepID=UPI0011E9FC4E|nr:interferon a3-like [Archocentrus centrarchus]XP_030591245.1 interferon a3-like [Archocentrus centrarchus]
MKLRLFLFQGDQLTAQDTSAPALRFPRNLYKNIRKSEVESKLVFIRDSLKLISCLYRHDNLSSAPWDADRTERFLTVIHRQITEVNACVSPSRAADSSLKRYYGRLANSTVSCAGCSTASWDLLRMETKLRLDQLELLVASIIRGSAAPSRRRSAAQQQHNSNYDTASEDSGDCF